MRCDYPRRGEIIKARIDFLRCLRVAVKEMPEYEELCKKIRQNENRAYVAWSLDNGRMVSYVSNPGVTHKHNYVRRTKTNLGRFLRRIMGCDFTDYSVDKFCRRCLATKTGHHDSFELISGHAITRAYSNSVGGGSCMTGCDSNYVQMYALNPDVCRMLVFRDDKLSARALIWKCDCGSTVMDRIYPNDGYHIELFEDYASKNGWLVRPDNSMAEDTIYLGGKIRSVTVTPHEEYWPYMDTFFGTDDDLDSSSVTLSSDNDMETTLDSQYGGPGNSRERRYCYCCEERIHQYDDAFSVHDEEWCESCFNEQYRHCDYCGNTVSHDDTSTVSALGYSGRTVEREWCEDCVERHAHTCSECYDSFANSDSVTVFEGSSYCNTCNEERIANEEPEPVQEAV